MVITMSWYLPTDIFSNFLSRNLDSPPLAAADQYSSATLTGQQLGRKLIDFSLHKLLVSTNITPSGWRTMTHLRPTQVLTFCRSCARARLTGLRTRGAMQSTRPTEVSGLGKIHMVKIHPYYQMVRKGTGRQQTRAMVMIDHRQRGMGRGIMKACPG